MQLEPVLHSFVVESAPHWQSTLTSPLGHGVTQKVYNLDRLNIRTRTLLPMCVGKTVSMWCVRFRQITYINYMHKEQMAQKRKKEEIIN